MTKTSSSHASVPQIALRENEKNQLPSAETTKPHQAIPRSFDKPVVLRQSPKWTTAITWTIMGVTAASVMWASVAKVEETVRTQGQLEPVSTTRLVQAPIGGVITDVFVEEGQWVEKGQPLAHIDKRATEAQLASSLEIANRLEAENVHHLSRLAGGKTAAGSEEIPLALNRYGRDRLILSNNNQLYRAQLSGNTTDLTAEQQDRVETAQYRLSLQQDINALQANQLREQHNQAQEQLNNAERDLVNNQDTARRLSMLYQKGAVAELSLLATGARSE